jgi:hypothetical protein
MLIEIVRLEDDNDDKNATELYRRANSHVMPFQDVKIQQDTSDSSSNCHHLHCVTSIYIICLVHLQ